MSWRSLSRAFLARLQRASMLDQALGTWVGQAAAEARARELLLRTLTPAQREEFQLHGWFAVRVLGRGTFWILSSTFFNVLHMETGYSYCAVARTEVPLSDLMLTQKLLLENDPEAFFAVANCRPELNPRLVDERLRPQVVMQARESRAPARIVCLQV